MNKCNQCELTYVGSLYQRWLQIKWTWHSKLESSITVIGIVNDTTCFMFENDFEETI